MKFLTYGSRPQLRLDGYAPVISDEALSFAIDRAPRITPTFSDAQVFDQIDFSWQWLDSQITYDLPQNAPSWGLSGDASGPIQDTHEWVIEPIITSSNAGAGASWSSGSGLQYALAPVFDHVSTVQTADGVGQPSQTGGVTHHFDINSDNGLDWTFEIPTVSLLPAEDPAPSEADSLAATGKTIFDNAQVINQIDACRVPGEDRVQKFAKMARLSTVIHMMVIACLVGGTMLAPASATELLRIKGVMAEGGIVCPLFRSDDGTIFPLMGLSQNEHAIGTRLELEGTFVKRSTCQQGEKTFNVESVIGIGGSEDR